MGQIDVPWAFDANGTAVDVSYAVTAEGARLILLVSGARSTVYPVTADPSFTSWVGELHCSWGSCTFYLERAKTYWIRHTFATYNFAVAAAIVGTAFCSWVVAGSARTGAVAFFAGLTCAAWVASNMWTIQNHANQGWSCLTLRKYHFGTTLYLGHASGSNSHCHYNV